MCIAMPGKVITREDNNATVDFSGNTIKVDCTLVDAKVGDYVLVHAGCAIEVMKPVDAIDLLALFDEIEEAAHDH